MENFFVQALIVAYTFLILAYLCAGITILHNRITQQERRSRQVVLRRQHQQWLATGRCN